MHLKAIYTSTPKRMLLFVFRLFSHVRVFLRNYTEFLQLHDKEIAKAAQMRKKAIGVDIFSFLSIQTFSFYV